MNISDVTKNKMILVVMEGTVRTGEWLLSIARHFSTSDSSLVQFFLHGLG